MLDDLARVVGQEVLGDVVEGADILMVKPAGPYLDIIRDLRNNTELPIAAYQVSGEYAQIHAAAQLGWLDLASGTALFGVIAIPIWGHEFIHNLRAGDGHEEVRF